VTAQRPLDTSSDDAIRHELSSNKTIFGQRASDALSNAADSAMFYASQLGPATMKCMRYRLSTSELFANGPLMIKNFGLINAQISICRCTDGSGHTTRLLRADMRALL